MRMLLALPSHIFYINKERKNKGPTVLRLEVSPRKKKEKPKQNKLKKNYKLQNKMVKPITESPSITLFNPESEQVNLFKEDCFPPLN